MLDPKANNSYQLFIDGFKVAAACEQLVAK